MKVVIIHFLFLMIFTPVCFGQTIQIKYYNSKSFKKEVSQSKAKFSLTTISNDLDGTTIDELKDLQTNEVIKREIYKNDEPIGTWYYRSANGVFSINYDFELIYSERCTFDTTSSTANSFIDNESLGYKAPVITSGESTLTQYILNNFRLSNRAIKEKMYGKIFLFLSISKEGLIENVSVKRGINKILDKEAVRVIRQLKLDSPPLINGQPININCEVTVISFKAD